jgi:hypothetical protein
MVLALMGKLWPLALFLIPFPLALLFGAPLLLFATLPIAGFGLTYWSGLDLRFEERAVYGLLLGAVAFTALSFLLSMAVRDVTLFTVLAGAALALALGFWGAWRGRTRLLEDAASFPARARSLWPLGLLTALCSAWIWHFFAQAYTYLPSGLYTGYVNIWGDWAAHLTFAGSFAYGHNFPPEFPIDPGNHLGYPFLVDFFAATTVPLGASLTSALVLTSTYLLLAFPPLFFLLAARFTASRLAGFLAPLIFLLGGGLGFVYLIPALDASGFGILSHLPHEYTLGRSLNYQWLNPVLAYLVPQRSTLFGFPLFLLVLLLFYQAHQSGQQWPTYAFLGLLTGLLPAFHVHAYVSVLGVIGIWALFAWRRSLLAFFVPALVLGLPVLAWMWPPANNSVCNAAPSLLGDCFQPGWLAATDWARDGLNWFFVDFWWFWIKNTALFLPLILLAHYMPRLVSPKLLKWFAPLWFWFVIPNLYILSPWNWDNTKLFIFFFLFGSVFVALLLANLAKGSSAGAVLAGVCCFLLFTSGALDLTRASNFDLSSNQFTDPNGVKLAAWVRAHTPPDAIFAVADEHNSPIPTLSGRRVMVGYPGWLWTYDLGDYVQKGIDEKKILQGDPSTPALLAHYHVSYVLVGPQELSPAHAANANYWAMHGTVVYSDGEYTLYQVG